MFHNFHFLSSDNVLFVNIQCCLKWEKFSNFRAFPQFTGNISLMIINARLPQGSSVFSRRLNLDWSIQIFRHSSRMQRSTGVHKRKCYRVANAIKPMASSRWSPLTQLSIKRPQQFKNAISSNLLPDFFTYCYPAPCTILSSLNIAGRYCKGIFQGAFQALYFPIKFKFH